MKDFHTTTGALYEIDGTKRRRAANAPTIRLHTPWYVRLWRLLKTPI